MERFYAFDNLVKGLSKKVVESFYTILEESVEELIKKGAKVRNIILSSEDAGRTVYVVDSVNKRGYRVTVLVSNYDFSIKAESFTIGEDTGRLYFS